MPDRWFTPATAGVALRRVRPVAETMCRLYLQLERARPTRVGGDQLVPARYFALVRRLNAAVAGIQAAGARIKDVRQGLLDFPARRAGRRVMLSWKVGEPAVAWWRETGAGPATRRPVDNDGPWDDV